MASATLGYTGSLPASQSRVLMDDHTHESSDELQPMSHWLQLVASERSRQAYTLLFRYFAPRIRAFGLRQLRNEAQAMELVQETLLTVWQKAHLYHPEKGATTTWVFTVMRNQCFDMLRRQISSKEQLVAEDLWPALEFAHVVEEGSPAGENQVLSQQLARYVHLLPASQQEVVRGVYLQQLTLQELAERFDVPLGTIKSRLRLALEKLREQVGHNHD